MQNPHKLRDNGYNHSIVVYNPYNVVDSQVTRHNYHSTVENSRNSSYMAQLWRNLLKYDAIRILLSLFAANIGIYNQIIRNL